MEIEAKVFVNENLVLMILVGKVFQKIDLEDKLRMSEDASYAHIVFCDGLGLIDLERIIKIINSKKPSFNIIITIMRTVTIEDIEKITALKQASRIKNICVTTEIVGLLSDIDRKWDNYILASEEWRHFPGEFKSDMHRFDMRGIDGERIHRMVCESERIVTKMLDRKPRTDLEKILIVDAWFQEHVQFVERETVLGNKRYLCDNVEGQHIYNVLENRYGVCEDIAFTASLIFSNSLMRIKCRVITDLSHEKGANGKIIGHTYNIVELDGKEYLLDISRNITRNPNKVWNALKATAYSFEHTLLGINDKAGYIKTNGFDISKISEEDYDRQSLIETLNEMKAAKKIRLNWSETVITESRVEEI